jgi:hypothetical protein
MEIWSSLKADSLSVVTVWTPISIITRTPCIIQVWANFSSCLWDINEEVVRSSYQCSPSRLSTTIWLHQPDILHSGTPLQRALDPLPLLWESSGAGSSATMERKPTSLRGLWQGVHLDSKSYSKADEVSCWGWAIWPSRGIGMVHRKSIPRKRLPSRLLKARPWVQLGLVVGTLLFLSLNDRWRLEIPCHQ